MARDLALFEFTTFTNRPKSSLGWFIIEGVVIDALAGNDTITGRSATDGIRNGGTLNTGDGNDTIKVSGVDYGVVNYGIINTGNGNDTINGIVTSRSGIGILNEGTINTEGGDDTITGINYTKGIVNYGVISTAAGNDNIIGRSYITAGGNHGIYNYGTIDSGAGNDVINALKGGFGGTGTIYLGTESDTLKGFGAGNFYGGTGEDKIILGKGIYTISGFAIRAMGVTMNANEFEQIGGTKGAAFAYEDGTLTVTPRGIGRFTGFPTQ